jgi:hypothetical protein
VDRRAVRYPQRGLADSLAGAAEGLAEAPGGSPTRRKGGIVTDRSVFDQAQWQLLVQLPRWVAAGASAAEHDSVHQTAQEEEAGLLAIADGRTSPSGLVAQIATELVEVYDEQKPDLTAPSIDVHRPEAGLAAVLERARQGAALIIANAQPTDATAYRRWLLAIADTVIGAARSGAVLGLGGQSVSENERRFREQLARTLEG